MEGGRFFARLAFYAPWAGGQNIVYPRMRVHKIPVDQVVDNRLQKIGPSVLVIEVVCVFPDVDGQQGLMSWAIGLSAFAVFITSSLPLF